MSARATGHSPIDSPSAHAWIFQATPATMDLAAELSAGDTLTWSISRYGRDVRVGDHVYYWQAGRDAGIYGLGRVASVSTRGPNRRFTVVTVHEHPLFAPISRTELRADPALSTLAVLRQPRGTVFPLTPAQDQALARRTGDTALVIAVPAERRRGHSVRLYPDRDAGLLPRVQEAHARGDTITVLLIDQESGSVRERMAVVAPHARRDGGLDLRLAPLPSASYDLPDDLAARVAAGAAVEALPVLPLPSTPEAARTAAESGEEYLVQPPFAPQPDELRGELEVPAALQAQLVAAVRAGRHIVLMGAPGTGKTTLALNLAHAAARAGLCSGPLLTTATADWTTFDTIGGLVPGSDGALHFTEGVVLRALRDNRWLVLDELNRADIDKAFGPLLTVLSGGPVELPTVTVGGRPVRLEPGPGPAMRSDDGAIYQVGSAWRIVATMNTLDRAALFSFSLAFARRFAFILVPPPDTETLLALVQRRVGLDEDALAFLRRLLAVTPTVLGPAIVLDAAGYMATRRDPAAHVEAVGAFVLPQLEGLGAVAVHAFAHELAPALDTAGAETLDSYIHALFGE